MKKRFSKLLILSMTTALTFSIVSANAFAEDIQASVDAGMDAHVAKPIDIEVLRATLTRVLGDAS